jgi:peptidyl-prolyl cis-trans isomerase C
MTRFNLARALGAVALIVACTLPAMAGEAPKSAPKSAAKGAASDPNRVVAVVDGYEIRMSDVNAARDMLPPEAQAYPPNVVFDYLLNSIVNSRIVAQEARKTGVSKNADVQRRMARLEERMLEQEYLVRRVEKELDEKKVREAFDRMIKETPPEEEVRARHILVADEKSANDVIARLNKGEDFAAIAKQVSTDGSAQAGGDLGYFTRERMVKPFSDAAFEMKPGTYSSKPVRSQFGFHVIRVEDKRNKKPPTFEEAADEVRMAARRELAESYVKALRDKAKVETFGMEGRPAKAAPKAGDSKKK